MAANPNGSFFYLFNLGGFGDEANIDNGQNLSLHSDSSLNHLNDSGLINSHLPPFSDRIVSTEFFHQNSLVSRCNHPTAAGLGQLGFRESTQTCITRNKLRVHSFTSYGFPLQNQVALASNDVIIFSEARRTTQLIERLLAPNNIILNQACHVPNEPFSYQPIPTKPPTIINNDNHHVDKRAIFTPGPINVAYAPQVKREYPDLDLNSCHNPNPSLESQSAAGIINLLKSNIGEPSRNLAGSSDNQTTALPDIGSLDDEDHRYDGRTHGLRGENGSYKCPKCDEMFECRYTFSSHIRIHYRGESISQKKRRLAARNKRDNKKLRLV